jgi:hypothetical protein
MVNKTGRFWSSAADAKKHFLACISTAFVSQTSVTTPELAERLMHVLQVGAMAQLLLLLHATHAPLAAPDDVALLFNECRHTTAPSKGSCRQNGTRMTSKHRQAATVTRTSSRLSAWLALLLTGMRTDSRHRSVSTHVHGYWHPTYKVMISTCCQVHLT